MVAGVGADTAVMAEMSEAQIESGTRAMAMLWRNHVDGSGHERPAGEAAANLMSESGLLDAPSEVLRMLTDAIEVGYAAALTEVRDGLHDDLTE